MPEITLPAATVASLAKYLLQWLHGLGRASEERRRECLQAIEVVLAAVRRTRRYVRERDKGRIDPGTEADLAVMWTELGFRLYALSVRKLAKRCDVKGQYWENPEKFSAEWWADADISLNSVETLARRLRAEIQANGAPGS